MAEMISKIDWSPLFISLKTGIVATIMAFFFWSCSSQIYHETE